MLKFILMVKGGKSKMRALSEQFMYDLKNPDGMLHPILERVKNDQTLMLAIRQDKINIYYRGGSLLRIEQLKYSYKTFFNPNYYKESKFSIELPGEIQSHIEAQKWVDEFSNLKQIMDFHIKKNPKAEREFQQLVARENNDSTISNESEYFISDIEVSDSELGARIDMLAIRWPVKFRKTGNNCKATFIEMKYADDALDNSSGLIKHLQDFDASITDKSRYQEFLEVMESQFNQLDDLGLLQFNKGTSNAKVKLNPDDRPEVIFILANHNPRSTKLKTILSDPQIDEYARANKFDLKFFVSSFAGYGLHTDCMLSLDEFRKLL